jgi:hypothetical protein
MRPGVPRSAVAVLSSGIRAALPPGIDLSSAGVVARLFPVLNDIWGAP